MKLRNRRKRRSFRDQLVVPNAQRKLVAHSCHDLPASEGNRAFKATFDKIREIHSQAQQKAAYRANIAKSLTVFQNYLSVTVPFSIHFNAWLLI